MKTTRKGCRLRALALPVVASALLAPPLMAQPSLSISGTSVTEGNTGSVQAVVTVTLTPASNALVTVNFESSAAQPPATGGAACGGGVDFVTPVGSLQFDPQVVSRTISVAVCGDTAEEPDEKFRVRLVGASGATIATSQGPVTIIDDDDGSATPTVSIDDFSYPEGNTTTATQNATVRLSASTNQTVTVAITALGGTATGGTCLSGADFFFLSRTLSIASGQTSLAVPFGACGNTTVEPDEAFTLVLRNPAGATLGDSLGQVTIANDDATTLSIDDLSFPEGNGGTTTQNATVRLSATSTQPVTTILSVRAGGTASGGSCALGDDFVPFLPRSLTINPGQTVVTIPLSICGGSTVEPDETLVLGLRSPVNATLGDSLGQVTITNDDVVQTRELGVDLTCAACPTQAAPDIIFFVTAKNTGNASASNVLVRYVLPKDVAFVGVEQNQLGTCQQNGTTADGALHVNCTLSSLPAGASRSVLIKGKTPATIADGTQLVSSAFIDPDNTIPEENDINNLELMFTTVRSPADIQVTGNVVKSRSQEPGCTRVLGRCVPPDDLSIFQLQLTVRNNGPATSRATTLSVRWPSGTTSRLGGVRSLGELCAPGSGFQNEQCVAGAIVPCFVSCTLPPLTSGQSVVVTPTGFHSDNDFQFTIGSQATATADPGQLVLESILSNNSITFTLSLP